jgi:hypothetical protein
MKWPFSTPHQTNIPEGIKAKTGIKDFVIEITKGVKIRKICRGIADKVFDRQSFFSV